MASSRSDDGETVAADSMARVREHIAHGMEDFWTPAHRRTWGYLLTAWEQYWKLRAQQPRRSIMAVAQAMEAKLQQYEHKPGWKREHWKHLAERLDEERHELTMALIVLEVATLDHARYAEFVGPDDTKTVEQLLADVLAEAADVCNFAMMLADRVGALPPTDERGR